MTSFSSFNPLKKFQTPLNGKRKLEHSVKNKNVSRNMNRTTKKNETKCQNNVAKFPNIILILQHFVFSIMFFAKKKKTKYKNNNKYYTHKNTYL